MGAAFVYEVYDNGEFVTSGTYSQLADKIEIPCYINLYARTGKRFLNRFTYKIAGNKPHKRDDKPIVPQKSKKQQRLEYVHEELMRSKVTCLGDRETPEDFLEYLREKGIIASVRYGKELTDSGKVKRYPILEVK